MSGMTQTFNCPNCGAAIEYSGTGRTMKCQYCSTVVQVPEELWRDQELKQTAAQSKRYVIIFLVITVGLPLCFSLFGTFVGLLGAIIGLLAPIFAILIQFLARLFIR
jgi:DNA-directed RNA polymerase subunit RPC12/RpoP